MSLLVRASVPRETSNGIIVEEASLQWIGFATTISFLSGLFQVLMGAFGLGVFVQLVSEPVMQGFITASALLMIVSQMAPLLGLPRCNASDLMGEGHDYDECYLQEYIASIVKHAGSIHVTTAIFSFFSLAFLLLFRFALPKTRLPFVSKLGPLLLLLLAWPVFFGMVKHYGTTSDEKGREFDAEWGVRIVGHIPSGLPRPSSPFDSVPTFRDVIHVSVSSLVIAVLGFMESMAIGTAVARQTKHGTIIPSRELVALGVSNLLCSITKGFPVTGSFSRTAANAESGARTQLSSLISAGLVAAVLLVMAPAVRYIPRFALASIVVVSVIRLINPRQALILYKTRMVDFLAFFIVVVVTMVGGFERGLACGIFISWIGTMLHRHPPKVELLRIGHEGRFVDVPESNSTVCDLAVVKLESSLLFSTVASAETAVETVASVFRPQGIVLDMSKCATIDASGLKMLQQLGEFAHDHLTVRSLCVVGLAGDARRVVERAANADDQLQWVLAPIVGGLGDGYHPTLIAFDSIARALEFCKDRIPSPRDPQDPTQAFSSQAYESVEEARLAAWRQGGNVPDIDPGWRVPGFARNEPFELVVCKTPGII